MSKVSIIIPVYIKNKELLDLTKAAFHSLEQTDWDNFQSELIFVDDCSRSFGWDFLRNHSDIYVRGKVNHGFPWAMNKGIQVSSGELIVAMNNDIRVSPNWLKVAKEILAQNDKVGMLHYKMVGYDEDFGLGDNTWISGKEKWCTGSFFIIKREALPEGLYDEKYGLGGFDDWDLQHRVRHINGWQAAYTNKAAYQHKDSSTQLLRDPRERTQSDIRSREYFKSKFGEYPEEIWNRLYPEQAKESWRPFP